MLWSTGGSQGAAGTPGCWRAHGCCRVWGAPCVRTRNLPWGCVCNQLCLGTLGGNLIASSPGTSSQQGDPRLPVLVANSTCCHQPRGIGEVLVESAGVQLWRGAGQVVDVL